MRPETEPTPSFAASWRRLETDSRTKNISFINGFSRNLCHEKSVTWADTEQEQRQGFY
jgi:hypothetical protein